MSNTSGFLFCLMAQLHRCNYFLFSFNNTISPNPGHTIPFSGIITEFSSITPPKRGKTPQAKVKITPMELHTR